MPCWGASRETPIFRKIALVAVFVLSSTMAFAQPSQGMMASDNGPTINAPTTSGSMNQDAAAGTKREDKKEYDRQLQRREHSRRRYGWRSAKKGRRYYARRSMKQQ